MTIIVASKEEFWDDISYLLQERSWSWNQWRLCQVNWYIRINFCVGRQSCILAQNLICGTVYVMNKATCVEEAQWQKTLPRPQISSMTSLIHPTPALASAWPVSVSGSPPQEDHYNIICTDSSSQNHWAIRWSSTDSTSPWHTLKTSAKLLVRANSVPGLWVCRNLAPVYAAYDFVWQSSKSGLREVLSSRLKIKDVKSMNNSKHVNLV